MKYSLQTCKYVKKKKTRKKTCNPIKGLSSRNICSEIKSQQVKKPFVIQYQKRLDFSQNFSVQFHRVIFDHPISYVLLIDKPNERC